MLSEGEYNELLPFKEQIEKSYNSQAFGRSMDKALLIIDRIRQNHRLGAVCFSCSGSVMNALNDAKNLIAEYEETII